MAIIGGLLISTLVTLILVPAIIEYIDIFREAVERVFRPKDAGWDEDDVEGDVTEDGKDAPANPFSDKKIKQYGKRKRVNKYQDN